MWIKPPSAALFVGGADHTEDWEVRALFVWGFGYKFTNYNCRKTIDRLYMCIYIYIYTYNMSILPEGWNSMCCCSISFWNYNWWNCSQIPIWLLKECCGPSAACLRTSEPSDQLAKTHRRGPETDAVSLWAWIGWPKSSLLRREEFVVYQMCKNLVFPWLIGTYLYTYQLY